MSVLTSICGTCIFTKNAFDTVYDAILYGYQLYVYHLYLKVSYVFHIELN